MLPGKRVDFDHCVVSADFIHESCMYSVLIFYTVRSMVGLPTCQIVECNELSSGIWRGKCPKFMHFYVRLGCDSRVSLVVKNLDLACW